MAECLGCGDGYAWSCESDLVNDRFGVCPTCRRHLEIGRLVEGMPDDSALMREGKSWIYDAEIHDSNVKWVRGKTPLAALKGKKDETRTIYHA